MDRSTLEGDPHSVIEAMAIAGYAIGASRGYIYIRAEYPLAIKRLQTAISAATDYGLLGEKILGSDFNFDIELRFGAGAFVCGEETALIESLEQDIGVRARGANGDAKSERKLSEHLLVHGCVSLVVVIRKILTHRGKQNPCRSSCSAINV